MSLKRNFLKNLFTFFWNSDSRRQIDEGEVTESFVWISAAVFQLAGKSGKGQNLPSPPAGRRLNYGQIIPYTSQVIENTLLFCGAVCSQRLQGTKAARIP